jgi:hypothetical protein
MIEDKIRKEYLTTYYGRVEDLSTWFNAGLMNRKIAELLLQKYNSAHKRFILQTKELMRPEGKKKKRRINPYYLVLHKYILMFFGLSLECYLKGLLIETKKLKPLSPSKKSLSIKCLRHLSPKMYKKVFGNIVQPRADTLARLQRAILAGKYPIEKNIKIINAYTAYLDFDIKETKLMIKEAKQKWQKLRFTTIK